ncbi:hypothetical protein G7054_g10697 [Neopestalotiopsis clavispora]|nr:hypothetical protein G7054_g10697 [Neopestalotiopsis clavispora]
MVKQDQNDPFWLIAWMENENRFMTIDRSDGAVTVVQQKTIPPQPLREFRYFSQLPAELRLTIWDLARPPVRHYLYMTYKDNSVCYVGYDCQAEDFMDSSITSEPISDRAGHLDPRKEQILLSRYLRDGRCLKKKRYLRDEKCSKKTQHLLSIPQIFAEFQREWYHSLFSVAPGYTSVFFKEDIFIMAASSRAPGKLASIQNHRDNSIEGNHWVTQIRTLGVHLTEQPGYTKVTPLTAKWSNDDTQVLSQMTSLEEVLLISDCPTCARHVVEGNLGHQDPDAHGFVHNFAYDLAKISTVGQTIANRCRYYLDHLNSPTDVWKCVFVKQKVWEVEGQMLANLARAGKPHVKVSVVIDAKISPRRFQEVLHAMEVSTVVEPIPSNSL